MKDKEEIHIPLQDLPGYIDSLRNKLEAATKERDRVHRGMMAVIAALDLKSPLVNEADVVARIVALTAAKEQAEHSLQFHEKELGVRTQERNKLTITLAELLAERELKDEKLVEALLQIDKIEARLEQFRQNAVLRETRDALDKQVREDLKAKCDRFAASYGKVEEINQDLRKLLAATETKLTEAQEAIRHFLYDYMPGDARPSWYEPPMEPHEISWNEKLDRLKAVLDVESPSETHKEEKGG